MKDLVLVTGASGGIGLQLVDQLLQRGYNVIGQYNTRPDSLNQLFNLHRCDVHVNTYHADLTQPNDVKEMRQAISRNHPGVPIWGVINLAGSSTNAMSWKMSADDFKHIIDVNLTSTFLVCKEFIPQLREAQGGRIINVSSVVASSGAVGATHYCAAKAGIEGLTRAMALELAPKNITVNALALGYFEVGLIENLTPQLQDNARNATPLRRFGRVAELTGLVEYLLSEESAFLTGQTLHVNGGFHL